MRWLAFAALALLVPMAQGAFVQQHPDEGYTSQTIDISSSTPSFTVRRHFTVNETEQAYVWFDPWTTDTVRKGFQVAYVLAPADASGAPTAALLSNTSVRNSDASPPATLHAGTTYVLQYEATLPPISQRNATTYSFVGVVALREAQGTGGSGGVLDPSIGTRLDVTFTGKPSPTPSPSPDASKQDGPVCPVRQDADGDWRCTNAAPEPNPSGPSGPAPTVTKEVLRNVTVPAPPIHLTNQFQVPWWMAAIMAANALLLVLALAALGRRRREREPPHETAGHGAPVIARDEGPFLLRDDPFSEYGPPRRL
ncbi:MAG: hypothetical protein ACYDBQ_01205 [Thermoplasmatota archaeon]